MKADRNTLNVNEHMTKKGTVKSSGRGAGEPVVIAPPQEEALDRRTTPRASRRSCGRSCQGGLRAHATGAIRHELAGIIGASGQQCLGIHEASVGAIQGTRHDQCRTGQVPAAALARHRLAGKLLGRARVEEANQAEPRAQRLEPDPTLLARPHLEVAEGRGGPGTGFDWPARGAPRRETPVEQRDPARSPVEQIPRDPPLLAPSRGIADHDDESAVRKTEPSKPRPESAVRRRELAPERRVSEEQSEGARFLGGPFLPIDLAAARNVAGLEDRCLARVEH
jgi:hypothetical protein